MEKSSNLTSNAFLLVGPDENALEHWYNWMKEEPRLDHFTCRPSGPLQDYAGWRLKTLEAIEKKSSVTRFLVARDCRNVPLGKATCFDFNPRNHSCEIGYYFPAAARHKGYGRVLLHLMLTAMFSDSGLNLNKIYATTAACNHASIRLLESAGFSRDGENREHYWIDDQKYSQLVYSLLRSEWSTQS